MAHQAHRLGELQRAIERDVADRPSRAHRRGSGDAEARYRVFLNEGQLWIAGAAAWNIPMEAAGTDRFVAGAWSLRFVHDGGGRVLGMQLHGPRIWNLWFDKTPDTD